MNNLNQIEWQKKIINEEYKDLDFKGRKELIYTTKTKKVKRYFQFRKDN